MNYFAYGTNMDGNEMADRCPGAIEIGIAVLRDHNFRINSRGVATVVLAEGRPVYGVLWKVTTEHLQRLDRYEGVPSRLYRRDTIKVFNNDVEVEAEIYFATDNSPGSPRNAYLERIVAAAIKHSFPEEYIQELRKCQKTGE